MANLGSMIAKRMRMEDAERNALLQASPQSRQGRCPRVPAGRRSHGLMEVTWGTLPTFGGYKKYTQGKK